MSKEKMDLKQITTDAILAKMAEGIIPWHCPWTTVAPRNFVSKKAYRGINILLLGLAGQASPWWLTYNQAAERGGQVRKGEKGTMIVFWKRLDVDDKDKAGEKKTISYMRYSKVFNASQIDGIEFPEIGTEFVGQDDADAVLDHFGEDCPIFNDSNAAYYIPEPDEIHLPAREMFESTGAYYATAFHEAGHATGHKDRLGREGVTGPIYKGSENYGKEELIAEMTSAFVCTTLGIDRIQPNAAYLQHWMNAINGDKNLVIAAASKATDAANYIMGITEEVTA